VLRALPFVACLSFSALHAQAPKATLSPADISTLQQASREAAAALKATEARESTKVRELQRQLDQKAYAIAQEKKNIEEAKEKAAAKAEQAMKAAEALLAMVPIIGTAAFVETMAAGDKTGMAALFVRVGQPSSPVVEQLTTDQVIVTFPGGLQVCIARRAVCSGSTQTVSEKPAK
jgi:hypothetical protein